MDIAIIVGIFLLLILSMFVGMLIFGVVRKDQAPPPGPPPYPPSRRQPPPE